MEYMFFARWLGTEGIPVWFIVLILDPLSIFLVAFLFRELLLWVVLRRSGGSCGAKSHSIAQSWLQSWLPGFNMFRFYGPEEAFYNKNFKQVDVELAK